MVCGSEKLGVQTKFGAFTAGLFASAGNAITVAGVTGWIAAGLRLLGAMDELKRCTELHDLDVESLRREVDALQREVDRIKQQVNP